MQPAGIENVLAGPARAAEIGSRATSILLVLFLASSMVGLSGRLLTAYDEARYAEIARGMLESGDWVTPRLSGIEHWHKPPLTYWTIAASFAVLGLNEFAARLPSALAAMASVVALYGLGRMLYGRRAGVLGAIVLASSLLFNVMGRLATPDMLLTCFTCWAVHFMVRAALHGDRRGSCAVLRGLFLGLGFMTKGPLIFIFVVVPALVFVAVTQRWKMLRAMKPWLSAATMCVVALPWFVVVCIQNAGLLNYLVKFQTFERVASDIHGRSGSLLYYVRVLLYGFFPWVLFLPYAIARGTSLWVRSLDEAKARGLFLLVLALVPFVFFSLSRSKGLAYLVPALPAAALLVGRLLDEAMFARDAWAQSFRVNVWVALVGMLLFAGWAVLLRRANAKLAMLDGHVMLLGTLLVCGALVTGIGLQRRRPWALVAGLAAPVWLAMVILFQTMPDMSGTISWEAEGKFFAEAIAARRSEGNRLVFYKNTSHSTSFYLRERPIFVACNVDLRFMGPAEYEGWVLDGNEGAAVLKKLFDKVGAAQQRFFCMTQKSHYESLLKNLNAPEVFCLATHYKFVLFSNRPDKPAQASVGGGATTMEESPE